jgi:hypothetical protein
MGSNLREATSEQKFLASFMALVKELEYSDLK